MRGGQNQTFEVNSPRGSGVYPSFFFFFTCGTLDAAHKNAIHKFIGLFWDLVSHRSSTCGWDVDSSSFFFSPPLPLGLALVLFSSTIQDISPTGIVRAARELRGLTV
jgi:hypothetical protein